MWLYIAGMLIGISLGVPAGYAACIFVQRRRARKVVWHSSRPPIVLVAPDNDPEAPVQSEEQEDNPIVLDARYVRQNLPGSNSKME